MNRRLRAFSVLGLAWLATILILMLLSAPVGAQSAPPASDERAEPPQVEGVHLLKVRSKLLSDFWGRDMFIEAGVVTPPGHDPKAAPTPACYSIHGFGGSHRMAWRVGEKLRASIQDGERPPMLYVFLNAQFPLGHHEFANSVNNGPWGDALVQEFLPEIERRFGAADTPAGRLLTGHSSGGWSSLWLQISYPETFGGVWSTAPDSIDFRDFTGINIYEFENAYVDPSGEPIQLVRGKDGQWVRTLMEYATAEAARREYGGQFASFDAVFSPRDVDGRPMRMFDRETGEIDPRVLDHWRKYDIVLKLKDQWDQLRDKLAGKLHIYIGLQDTYRLEGAVKLAKAELEQLGSDAEILLVEGRNHGNLFAPHPEHWPDGLLKHIHTQMWETWRAAQDGPSDRGE